MKQVFPIVAAPAGTSLVGVFVLLLVLALAILLLTASRFVKFEISPEGLRIRGDIYGRLIPSSALLVEQARPIDLTADRDYQLKLRTNGMGLPGYSGGWHRLRNGQKCLAFVTDKKRAVYIPTRDGYVVLLSVEQPDQFLVALRQSIR